MHRMLKIILVMGLAFGLLYRIAPLVVSHLSAAEFFITEDGYLMLTVSRNLAIGNGLSVSDGQIVTNGIQPLATFLYSLSFLVTDGDKQAGIVGVVLLATAVAVLGAWAVHGFARRVLHPLDPSGLWALLAATLWFVGPKLVFSSMNGLETGLYTLMLVVTSCYFADLLGRPAPYTLKQQVVLGVLSGLVFLARIDGAFFVMAIFLVRFVHVQWTGRLGFLGAVAEALPPGIISLCLAAPWLIFNYNLFGTIMPISGISQSANAGFADNAALVPTMLFEHMFPMLPIPGRFETAIAVVLVTAVLVLAVTAAYFASSRLGRTNALATVLAYTIFAAVIVAYYGLFFGAPYFLTRYFAPLAPLLIVMAIFVGLVMARALTRIRGPEILAGLSMAGIVLCAFVLGRQALPDNHAHEHFQVVRWVQTNVPEGIWVGAVQTGTLGFWHDRTINLDGKVNPAALRARLEEGSVLRYVLESDIQYLADWVGITTWVDAPNKAFTEAFEVIVKDEKEDLGVLRRR